MDKAIPRVMLVGTGSGAGKTTVTCGILRALVARGLSLSSFKCGPDYIDPMFHSRIIGACSSNLDLFLSGEETVRFLLAKNSADTDFSVIEGVMGMYDGLGFESDGYSSNHLALATQTPELLIVNVKGMGLSLAAMLQGYRDFRQNNLQGVIFNGCTAGMYPVYRRLVNDTLGLRAYGYFPDIPQAAFESRHLGLITADEVSLLQEKLDLLAHAAEECIDLDGILSLGKNAPPLSYEDKWNHLARQEPVRVAVARDKAFCFFYQDNLDLLERLGAELLYFSPLTDSRVPKGAGGLILWGGYPEEYAKELSENAPMLSSIKEAVQGKMPVIAECGGFMYLLERMTDRAGNAYEMVGALPGECSMTEKLSRFGYLTLSARNDNLLCRAGGKIPAHEFHYSDSTNNGCNMTAHKRGREWDCIHASDHLFAGYPHLHFADKPELLQRFLMRCREYGKEQR